jgi:hypothetical protein
MKGIFNMAEKATDRQASTAVVPDSKSLARPDAVADDPKEPA